MRRGAWPTRLRLPRKVDGAWQPYNPAEWRAYASRQRWFRTPNDAFMTGNFHVSQSLLQNVLKTQTFSWVQLLLASIYSGAFHPTAEGQAAIADAVVEQARGVIAKYDGRRRAAKNEALVHPAVGRQLSAPAYSSLRPAVAEAFVRCTTRESVLSEWRSDDRERCITARSAPATAAPTR